MASFDLIENIEKRERVRIHNQLQLSNDNSVHAIVFKYDNK